MRPVTLPIRTVSEANARGHWVYRARRAQLARRVTELALRTRLSGVRAAIARGERVVVALERIAPSNGLDDDNLRASLKSVRDGVADALGLVSDRDPRVRWDYRQRRGRMGEYAVQISVTMEADDG
jgi:hypothetical protein